MTFSKFLENLGNVSVEKFNTPDGIPTERVEFQLQDYNIQILRYEKNDAQCILQIGSQAKVMSLREIERELRAL